MCDMNDQSQFGGSSNNSEYEFQKYETSGHFPTVCANVYGIEDNIYAKTLDTTYVVDLDKVNKYCTDDDYPQFIGDVGDDNLVILDKKLAEPGELEKEMVRRYGEDRLLGNKKLEVGTTDCPKFDTEIDKEHMVEPCDVHSIVMKSNYAKATKGLPKYTVDKNNDSNNNNNNTDNESNDDEITDTINVNVGESHSNIDTTVVCIVTVEV